MIKKAIVAKTDVDSIDLLSLDEIESSQVRPCGSPDAHGASGCHCQVSGRPFKAAVPEGFTVNPGDKVEVQAPFGLSALIFVLGMPTAGAAIGWNLGIRLSAQEGTRVLFALGGMALFIALLTLVPQKRKKLPKIIRVTT